MFLLKLPGDMRIPCLSVGREPGGPCLPSAPGLGGVVLKELENRGSELLGTPAESHTVQPLLAAKASYFLPSVMGVSGETLSFLVC